MNNKTVLITGGSEGIGLQLAKEFSKDAKKIILVARNIEKLEKAKRYLEERCDCKVYYYNFDLTKFENTEKLYQKMIEDGHRVDILINNAGIGYVGKCIEIDPVKQINCIMLNDAAVVGLCSYFGKDMAQRKTGEIINVGSTAAYQPGPFMATYYASKAFLESYTASLKEELKDENVTVHLYTFGPVDTEFYRKSNSVAPVYAMNVEKAAAYCYRHRDTKRLTVLPGWTNRIARFVPKNIKMKFIKRVKGKEL